MNPPGAAPDELTDRVLAMLELTPIGSDAFVGARVAMGLPRVFGGQVLAQALVAAGRTVPEKTAHSLHAYFLRAGDPGEPIRYDVQRVRDGRRLSCRTVTAHQHGRSIATVTMSFAATSGGVAHQIPAPASIPAPQVPTLAESASAWGGLGPAWGGFDALEIRVDPRRVGVDSAGRTPTTMEPGASTDQLWQRVPFRLPAEPLLHQAFLVYASDVTILAAALVPHGVPVGCEEVGGRLLWDGVSVDHAIWFHGPVRADEWMLFDQLSPVAADGRAFTRAEVFTADGRMMASVAQEGLILGLDDGS